MPNQMPATYPDHMTFVRNAAEIEAFGRDPSAFNLALHNKPLSPKLEQAVDIIVQKATAEMNFRRQRDVTDPETLSFLTPISFHALDKWDD